jgi:hypothetical protein
MTATWTAEPAHPIKASDVTIKNLYIFIGIAAVLISYILYTMIRPRKGERPGFQDREPDL